MEEKIVYTALENLRKHTGIEGWFTATYKDYLDGELRLLFNNGEELFTVAVKKEVRGHQMEQIRHLGARHKNLLMIAGNFFPKIKEELRKMKVGYLDTAGNIFIQTEKYHLWIEGQKKEKAETGIVNRAFTPTGLKAVYLFLIDENMVNQPQRTGRDGGVDPIAHPQAHAKRKQHRKTERIFTKAVALVIDDERHQKRAARRRAGDHDLAAGDRLSLPDESHLVFEVGNVFKNPGSQQGVGQQ